MDKISYDIAKQWGQQWSESSDAVINLKDPLLNYKYGVFKKLLAQLPKNAKIIEIGCGNSSWLKLLKEKNPQIEIYGLDISLEAIEISKKYGIKTILGDIRNAPFEDNYFDLVFSFGTIEHFPETKKALLEHIRILKPNGFAWIEVPNKISLQGLEKIFSNWRHKRDKYKVMIEQGKHYSFWQLKKMAQDSSYKFSIKIQGSGPVVPYYRFFKIFDLIFPNFIRRFFGGNAGIILKKRQ